MTEPAYPRVVVKISGEALAASEGFGIHQPIVERIAADLVAASRLGIEIAVVVGGGNIFRGVQVSSRGVPRPVGDTMGMLATVMNALVLEAAIERQGCEARTLSALVMPSVCESYNRPRPRQPVLYARPHRRAARGGTRCQGRAQGHQCRWHLHRRSEEG